MSEALERVDTVSDVRARVNRIQEVMRSIMKDGVHFGKIPGAGDKPVLLKAGAEVILSTFRIAVDPLVEDMSTPDCARYRVLCRGVLPSGAIVGTGVGEASSDETKYQWRAAVCEQEYDATDPARRRAAWKHGRNGVYVVKQVRMNPADVSNTVLKMAKKRAQIDLCLTATAASDVFSQDIEDMPDEVREAVTDEKPTMQPPKAKEPAPDPAPANGGALISERQRKRFFAIGKGAGWEDAGMRDLIARYGYQHSTDIKVQDYEALCAALEAGPTAGE